MAITTTVTTEFGEEKELYLRINNAEISNHGVKSTALVRGYISKDAFLAGAKFMWEESVVCDIDIGELVWSQFYNALKLNHREVVDC